MVSRCHRKKKVFKDASTFSSRWLVNDMFFRYTQLHDKILKRAELNVTHALKRAKDKGSGKASHAQPGPSGLQGSKKSSSSHKKDKKEKVKKSKKSSSRDK